MNTRPVFYWIYMEHNEIWKLKRWKVVLVILFNSSKKRKERKRIWQIKCKSNIFYLKNSSVDLQTFFLLFLIQISLYEKEFLHKRKLSRHRKISYGLLWWYLLFRLSCRLISCPFIYTWHTNVVAYTKYTWMFLTEKFLSLFNMCYLKSIKFVIT